MASWPTTAVRGKAVMVGAGIGDFGRSRDNENRRTIKLSVFNPFFSAYQEPFTIPSQREF
jgi:hypothetical protein